MNPFLWRVEAQVDGIASPTIPYTPPDGNPELTPTPQPEGPYITVLIDKPTIGLGDTATVTVRVDSHGQQISQYTVELLFDPNVIKVTDAQPIDAEIQVNSLETTFSVIGNQVAQNTGIISFSARNDSGTLSLTNKPVFNFQIEGLEDGFSDIKIDTGRSSMINAGSVNILQNTNDASVTVDSSITNVTIPPTSIPIGPSPTIDPNITQTPIIPTTTLIPIPSGTPDTAIGGSLATAVSVTFGALLIIAGGYIRKSRKQHASSR